jgi:hypothetical protein
VTRGKLENAPSGEESRGLRFKSQESLKVKESKSQFEPKTTG